MVSDGADRCYPETLDQPSISQQDGKRPGGLAFLLVEGHLCRAGRQSRDCGHQIRRCRGYRQLGDAERGDPFDGRYRQRIAADVRHEPSRAAGQFRAPVRLWVAAVFLGIRRRGADLRLRRGFLFHRGSAQDRRPGADPKCFRQLYRARARDPVRDRLLVRGIPRVPQADQRTGLVPHGAAQQGSDRLRRAVRGFRRR